MEDEMDRALEREMRRNYNRLREIAEARARRQQLRRSRYEFQLGWYKRIERRTNFSFVNALILVCL